MEWPRITIVTNHTMGEETVTYSPTPEEFVERLREAGETVYVISRSCAECFYTPERSIPEQGKRELDALFGNVHVPECICATVAHRLGKVAPDFLICYGFYYQYWHENSYLRAAHEAGLILFYDGTDLPGLRGSGLRVYGSPYWQFDNYP